RAPLIVELADPANARVGDPRERPGQGLAPRASADHRDSDGGHGANVPGTAASRSRDRIAEMRPGSVVIIIVVLAVGCATAPPRAPNAARAVILAYDETRVSTSI